MCYRAAMKLKRWTVLTAVLLSCLSAVAETALSEKQKKARAREIYEAGERAFRIGDAQVAADRFKESYQLYPTPLILFNLGQVHKQLGDLEKAAFFFKQYLAASEAENRYREDAQRRLEEVERALEEKRRATPAAPPASTTASPQPSPPEPVVAIATPPPKRTNRTFVIAGGAMLGLGVVGLAVGGAGAALASSAADDLTAATRAGDSFDAATERRGKAMQTMSIVGFAVGGVAAVTGGVLIPLGAKGRGQ